MAIPDRKNLPSTHNTEQGVLNTSFDEEFGVLAVEGLTYNPVTGKLERQTSVGQGNPSLVLTYTSDQLTTIAKTIGTTTYTKSLTWVAGNVTAISSWS